MEHVQDLCYIKTPTFQKYVNMYLFLKNYIVFEVLNFLVRFSQRQASYDVTDIVSHPVAVLLANIDQK